MSTPKHKSITPHNKEDGSPRLEPDLEYIGRRIRSLRRRRDMSLADMAEALGTHAPTVSSWQAGRAAPRYTVLGRLCDVFDVSAEWILFGRVVLYGDRRAQDALTEMETAREQKEEEL